MDEDDAMMPEIAMLLSDDQQLEALMALIEQRVVERLTLIFERLALERDGGA